MAKTTTQNGTKKAGKMKTLIGIEAVEYARKNAKALSKYADPIEDAREGLSVEEAREIAREDPNLIHLDVEAPTRRMAKKMAKDKTVLDHIQECDG